MQFIVMLSALNLVLCQTTGATQAEDSPSAPAVRAPVSSYCDFDGDGLLDIYAVDPVAGDHLYRNRDHGQYADVTQRSGLGGLSGTRMALWQDFDADGFHDLYVCAISGRSRLFQNRGGAGFVDVTVSAGIAHQDGQELFAEWIDFDGDGLHDLHVVTIRGDRLFRNLGGGFEEADLSGPDGVTALRALVGATGISTAQSSEGASPACSEGIVDQADPSICIQASSIPRLGTLMPLSRVFSISGGNVGIRTGNPTEALDIALGDKSFQIRRDGNLVPGINLVGTGGNAGILRLRNQLEIWPNDAQTSNGYLDVRDTSGSPRCRLFGTGAMQLDSGEQTPLRLEGSHTGGTWLSLNNTSPGGNEWVVISTGSTNGEGPGKLLFRDQSSGVLAMTINSAGDVGIGRLPALNRLEVEGDASKLTVGDWLANSDRRIKTDIHEIDGALATLERLRPVAFHYSDEYVARHPAIEDKQYYNVIAQEFAEVFPDYVKDSGEDGLLQVDVHPALIHAVAAVKELHELALEQEAEIASLEQRLARLEGSFATMSAVLEQR